MTASDTRLDSILTSPGDNDLYYGVIISKTAPEFNCAGLVRGAYKY